VKLPSLPNSSPRRIELELPAVHEAVRVARSSLRSFLRMSGVPDREVDTLVLVASELLGNAIDHGGGEAAMEEDLESNGTRMLLRLELQKTTWTLFVEDQGGGDPDEVRHRLQPDGLPDLEDERGRGFFLMAQLVDRMEVEQAPGGRGLRITAVHEYGRT
jgi:anti-sigma regulatory factor (Ser/Thr protein kinase)